MAHKYLVTLMRISSPAIYSPQYHRVCAPCVLVSRASDSVVYSLPFYPYPEWIGRVKVNLLPFPTSLSTQILPPCSSTNFLASVKPSPVPSVLCA